MAQLAAFASIPVVGSAVVSATADTVYTAPTHAVLLLGGQGPRVVTDGVTNSTTLVTSATASWSSGDVGRPIAGGTIPAGTTIETITSATNAVMSQAATGSGSSVALTMGGGLGTLIQEVAVVGVGTTLAGVVNTFLQDPAGAYHMHDSFLVTAVIPSTVLAPFRIVRDYQNLWLPPGWNYMATSWVASQLVNVVATGLNA